MHNLTSKSGFLQYYRSAAALRAGDFDSSRAWPAPVKKADTLVLKRPPTLAPDIFATPEESASAAPFPNPVRENAFELPRPAVVPGASAAWAPPLRKSPAAVLGAESGSSAQEGFSRPAGFTEKLSMRHGQFCRSC